MSPLKVNDQLQKELDEQQRRSKLGNDFLAVVKKSVNQKLRIRLREGNLAIEYRICQRPKLDVWPFGWLASRRPLVQILEMLNDKNCEFKLVVLALAHKELAENIASFLSLVHNREKIELITTHTLEPITESYSSDF
jgi:hypothetical protein